MINDAHVHFFSPNFLDTLGVQKGFAQEGRAAQVAKILGWDDPGSPEALADRWVSELDRHGVVRAAIIASVPGDEASVAAALARHPSRLLGYFMLDPMRDDALARVDAAFASGLRGVCLFPAMQRYSIHDAKAVAIFERTAAQSGAVVFVHCGVLSVGVRKKLGLQSPFDIRFGNPLDLHGIALRFPSLPIIVPHFGAGLFRETLMVASLCPNVYMDTSSSNSWTRYVPGLSLPQVFATARQVVGTERLLFGTDSSFFPRGWNREVFEAQSAAMTDAGFDDAAREQVLGGNFARLLPG